MRCARSIPLALCGRRLHRAVALAAVAAVAAAPGAFAADSAGERKGYKFEGQRLNDRLELKVNVATGNLLVKATDLTIAGTGLDVRVERLFNSTSTRNEALSPGWLLGVGHDVRLEFPSDDSVLFRAPTGYEVRFTKDDSGGYSAPRDPGIDAKLKPTDDAGWELKWHSKERYLFDASGRWTEHRDKNDNVIRFGYSGTPSRVSQITDTRGRSVTFGYTSGRLTAATDAAGGRTYAYTYDASGRLASSAVTSYALATDNVNLNVRTLYDYDSSGRLAKITDPRGNATTFGYDGTSRKLQTITRVTDASAGTGPTTRFTYLTSLDRCANEQDVVRETKVDGPRTDVADVTSHCLDAHDRSIAAFDAKGHRRSTKYASNSNVAELNESGVTSGTPFSFQWSSDDQLSSVKLPSGGQAYFDYGDAGNLHMPTSVRDFSAGSQTAPATWAYDYDADGNLIEAKNAGEGITYRYCYRADGNVDRIAPPALDGLPLDESTSGSSCSGHAQGNDTLFSYNTKGELEFVDPPGNRGSVTLTYDALSRVKTRNDARGARMEFVYDALDRVTRIDYTQPSLRIPGDDGDTTHTWINYTYDTNGNLTARSDSNGNSGFDYDALNRMWKETPEAPSASTTYTYDDAGNVVRVEATDEPAAVRYGYDSTNLVSSVVDQEGRTTTFSYNSKGLRRKTTYPGSVSMESRYDKSRRLKCTYAYKGTAPATDPADDESCPSPSTSLLTYYAYGYDRAGTDTNRRDRVTERDGSVTTYDYDLISRLKKATTRSSGGSVTREHAYTYDAESNLTREQVSGSAATGETRSQAYDLDGALCWSASGAHDPNCGLAPLGATTYSYAADGALLGTSAGLKARYSLRGHMIEVTPPGGSAIAMKYTDATQDRRINAGDLRMAYNQLGLSTQAPTNSASNATWFPRDPSGTVLGMLAAKNATTDLYYLFDGLGSIAATVDPKGNLVRRYAYEPYGEEIGRSSTDGNPWRYASGYFDNATGMLKYGTRYYVPGIARWTQRDPVMGRLANPATLNAYAYVGSDPINAVDPTGRHGAWIQVSLGPVTVGYAEDSESPDDGSWSVGAGGGFGMAGGIHTGHDDGAGVGAEACAVICVGLDSDEGFRIGVGPDVGINWGDVEFSL
jgi:RHS repeat-associated protein